MVQYLKNQEPEKAMNTVILGKSTSLDNIKTEMSEASERYGLFKTADIRNDINNTVYLSRDFEGILHLNMYNFVFINLLKLSTPPYPHPSQHHQTAVGNYKAIRPH